MPGVAVRSHIVQTLLHDLKVAAWPASGLPLWRAKSRMHRDEARDDYLPSMAGKIDMAKLYQRALRGLPEFDRRSAAVACPGHLSDHIGRPARALSRPIVADGRMALGSQTQSVRITIGVALTSAAKILLWHQTPRFRDNYLSILRSADYLARQVLFVCRSPEGPHALFS